MSNLKELSKHAYYRSNNDDGTIHVTLYNGCTRLIVWRPCNYQEVSTECNDVDVMKREYELVCKVLEMSGFELIDAYDVLSDGKVRYTVNKPKGNYCVR